MSRLKKAWFLASAAAQERLQYPVDLLGSSGFLVVLLFVFHRLYGQVLPAGTAAAGFRAADVLWYVVLAEAILMSFPRLDGVVDQEVKTGSLATYLTRPVSYVGYHQARFMGEGLPALLVNLAVGSLVAAVLAGPPPFPPAGVACFLVSAGLAQLIQFQIAMALALSSFWVEDAKPFFWVYQKTIFILGGLMMPLDFFPAWLRAIADALPMSQMLYVPARLALGVEPGAAVRALATQAAWAVGLGLVTRAVFRAGLRRLTVAGG